MSVTMNAVKGTHNPSRPVNCCARKYINKNIGANPRKLYNIALVLLLIVLIFSLLEFGTLAAFVHFILNKAGFKLPVE